MPLTTAGRNQIAALLIDDSSPTPFDNTNAYLGSGDSNTAFNVAQTDLQASSNKTRKAMESSYPQRSTNVLTFRSLFGTGDANWAWLEWALFNASSSGVMLTRKQEDLGTKTSAQSWLLTAELTVSIGS
jgi:hypothetical protein